MLMKIEVDEKFIKEAIRTRLEAQGIKCANGIDVEFKISRRPGPATKGLVTILSPSAPVITKRDTEAFVG